MRQLTLLISPTLTGKTDILWEPGVTFNTTEFKVANKGTLALKYKLVVNGVDGDEGLLKVIKFSVISEGKAPLLSTPLSAILRPVRQPQIPSSFRLIWTRPQATIT